MGRPRSIILAWIFIRHDSHPQRNKYERTVLKIWGSSHWLVSTVSFFVQAFFAFRIHSLCKDQIKQGTTERIFVSSVIVLIICVRTYPSCSLWDWITDLQNPQTAMAQCLGALIASGKVCTIPFISRISSRSQSNSVFENQQHSNSQEAWPWDCSMCIVLSQAWYPSSVTLRYGSVVVVSVT